MRGRRRKIIHVVAVVVMISLLALAWTLPEPPECPDGAVCAKKHHA